MPFGGPHRQTSSVDGLEAARAAGLSLAVVTSSESAGAVLRVAGLEGAVDVVVDGTVAQEPDSRGKPALGLFLEAAQRLGVESPHAAVFKDTMAGVAAGRGRLRPGRRHRSDRTGPASYAHAAPTSAADLVD